MTNREKDIDGILNGSLEALKAQDWNRSSALSLYAIANLLNEQAQAQPTPAPVEVQTEAPRRAPRVRTSSAGDADCGTCGERFNSKDGKYKHCYKCGTSRRILCKQCRTNLHQPEYDECSDCKYGEAA